MQWRDDTTLPSRGLGLRPIGKLKLAAFDAAGDISSTPIIEPAGMTAPPRHRAASERAASRHWFSAADREMKAETFPHTYSKMLMALAAGLPTIFQDRANVAAGGVESYRLFQRETSLEVRQRFIVGPDDE